jgi:hypothetical protein
MCEYRRSRYTHEFFGGIFNILKYFFGNVCMYSQSGFQYLYFSDLFDLPLLISYQEHTKRTLNIFEKSNHKHNTSISILTIMISVY